MLAVLEFWDLFFIFLIVFIFAGSTAGANAMRKRRSGDSTGLIRVERMLVRVEAKLDLLLSKAGLEYQALHKLPPEVVAALEKGLVSRAVEIYERSTAMPHDEALAFIEDVFRRKAF
jgi:hypothetical protein